MGQTMMSKLVLKKEEERKSQDSRNKVICLMSVIYLTPSLPSNLLSTIRLGQCYLALVIKLISSRKELIAQSLMNALLQ